MLWDFFNALGPVIALVVGLLLLPRYAAFILYAIRRIRAIDRGDDDYGG